MRFRKKPVVVDAAQFFPDQDPWPDGVEHLGSGLFQIETLEGAHKVSPGDWVITGVKGERYPCKPDIFTLTYEPVEEGGER